MLTFIEGKTKWCHQEVVKEAEVLGKTKADFFVFGKQIYEVPSNCKLLINLYYLNAPQDY